MKVHSRLHVKVHSDLEVDFRSWERCEDALWEALDMKARSPKKFMNVSNVKVSVEDGVLSRNMTCEIIKIMTE